MNSTAILIDVEISVYLILFFLVAFNQNPIKPHLHCAILLPSYEIDAGHTARREKRVEHARLLPVIVVMALVVHTR